MVFGRWSRGKRGLAQQLRDLQDEMAFLRESFLPHIPSPGARDFTKHPHVTMGKECRLAPDVNFLASSQDFKVDLGDHVKINRRSEICGPVKVGDYTFINSDAYIRQQTVIGSRVLIGPFVRLISDTHEMGTSKQRAGKGAVAAIIIEDGVWIGASVTVIGPVTIGTGSMVAAGSLVVKDVPPNTLVGGVPAKVIRAL